MSGESRAPEPGRLGWGSESAPRGGALSSLPLCSNTCLVGTIASSVPSFTPPCSRETWWPLSLKGPRSIPHHLLTLGSTL